MNLIQANSDRLRRRTTDTEDATPVQCAANGRYPTNTGRHSCSGPCIAGDCFGSMPLAKQMRSNGSSRCNLNVGKPKGAVIHE